MLSAQGFQFLQVFEVLGDVGCQDQVRDVLLDLLRVGDFGKKVNGLVCVKQLPQ